MLFDFLKQKHECHHAKVPVDTEEAYCPDCGALVKNKWYLVRCGCCNIKRAARSEYNDIKPNTKYCPNCGATEFYIQELDNINFTDVPYAIYKKVVIRQEKFTTSQIWIEKEEYLLQEKKLLKLRK